MHPVLIPIRLRVRISADCHGLPRLRMCISSEVSIPVLFCAHHMAHSCVGMCSHGERQQSSSLRGRGLLSALSTKQVWRCVLVVNNGAMQVAPLWRAKIFPAGHSYRRRRCASGC